MSRQFWSEALVWATGNGVAVGNTASETIVFPNITIPANYMQDGRALRLRVQGQHSTTGTPTLIFRVRWGGVAGTLLCLSPTFTCGSGVTANMFDMNILLSLKTNGATGTLEADGVIVVNGATVPVQAMCVGGASAPAATTVDLTGDTAFSVTAQWGTANASNTLTGRNYLLEAVN